ncbi:MAG TPA: hypothetical protein VEL28_14365 [Candidatus Binatia bacterium]|nr:hypothetical protein [Candidatus Binatia bacterium]
MSRLEQIEKQVASLSPEELEAFRSWFAEFDAAAWDREIAADVRAGKLDELVEEAKADYNKGQCNDR